MMMMMDLESWMHGLFDPEQLLFDDLVRGERHTLDIPFIPIVGAEQQT